MLEQPRTTSSGPASLRIRVLEDLTTPGGAGALQQSLAAALTTGHPTVVLDLRAAALGGTAELSVLCAGLRRLASRGARLTVTGLPPHIRRVLELCAIDGLEVVPAAYPKGRHTPATLPTFPQ